VETRAIITGSSEVGIALGLGPRDRQFESGLPDFQNTLGGSSVGRALLRHSRGFGSSILPHPTRETKQTYTLLLV
jgi:hypothetical protein